MHNFSPIHWDGAENEQHQACGIYQVVGAPSKSNIFDKFGAF